MGLSPIISPPSWGRPKPPMLSAGWNYMSIDLQADQGLSGRPLISDVFRVHDLPSTLTLTNSPEAISSHTMLQLSGTAIPEVRLKGIRFAERTGSSTKPAWDVDRAWNEHAPEDYPVAMVDSGGGMLLAAGGCDVFETLPSNASDPHWTVTGWPSGKKLGPSEYRALTGTYELDLCDTEAGHDAFTVHVPKLPNPSHQDKPAPMIVSSRDLYYLFGATAVNIGGLTFLHMNVTFDIQFQKVGFASKSSGRGLEKDEQRRCEPSLDESAPTCICSFPFFCAPAHGTR